MLANLHSGRWEARVGVPGSKHVYLGLYDSEEAAARAYDSSLVRLRGSSAATNFALSEYRTDLAAYHKLHQVRLGPPVFLTCSCALPSIGMIYLNIQRGCTWLQAWTASNSSADGTH